jgi:glycosyltransferase involved in cell wall biosynthesis
MPTVSVIMPAYNVAAYIGQAVESALAQTFRDFEVVIVDDGSTDRSAAIADGYAARDERLRVFRKKNGGISSARNYALGQARGSVIALLDSDDVWDPGYLEAQMSILTSDPGVDIVTANARDLGGKRDGLPTRPFPDSRPEPTLARILGDEEAVFIMCVFHRRVYETLGDFDESLPTNEDYDYWLRAAAHGFRFRRNDRPLGYYRRRADSLSASPVKMLQGILRVYTKIRPLLTDRPLELAILESQVVRFETERLLVEAREAIAAGNMRVAAQYLDLLRRRRRHPAATVAHFMARWTPRLLARAYQFRQALREAS